MKNQHLRLFISAWHYSKVQFVFFSPTHSNTEDWTAWSQSDTLNCSFTCISESGLRRVVTCQLVQLQHTSIAFESQIKAISNVSSSAAKKKHFQMMRKMHYNEGLNIKLARQLIASELEDDEDADEEMRDDTEEAREDTEETEEISVDPPQEGKERQTAVLCKSGCIIWTVSRSAVFQCVGGKRLSWCITTAKLLWKGLK